MPSRALFSRPLIFIENTHWGHLCPLGWQLSPKPLQPCFTVTQSELSSIYPNPAPPLLSLHLPFLTPSTASCSEKHPLTGLWEMPHHQEVGALQ